MPMQRCGSTQDAAVVHDDNNDDCMAYDSATRIVKRKHYRVCVLRSHGL
jgi:hypothetical protein